MKAIDLIRKALAVSDRLTLGLIADMRDQPLRQPGSAGGNHPLWVLGHLAFVEGSITRMVLGEPNRVAQWATIFGPGTEPGTDASVYPPFDEVFRTYRELRARNLQLLEELGDAGLERPLKVAPPGMSELFRTAADVFLILGSMHQMHHRGQVADCRRAAGRTPLLVAAPAALPAL